MQGSAVERDNLLAAWGEDARKRSQAALARAQAVCHRSVLALERGKFTHHAISQVPPTVMVNAQGEYLVLKVFERAEEISKRKLPVGQPHHITTCEASY